MILAADVGGSKTLVGLFERVAPRPRLIEARAVRTLDYPDLMSLLRAACPIGPEVDAIALGVAGPIVEHEATLTNVPWRVKARDVVEGTGVARLRLLNDLEAMAYAVPVLAPDELHTLQAGRTSAHGNAALIAAGTGLGEATLHRVDGAWWPVPSEAGHADFAARTDAELALVAALRERFGRVDVERVVSGLGLINLARHVHRADRCAVAGGFDEDGATARVSDAAAAGTCERCVTVLEMFVDAYGAEAGNLALRAVATSGLYVGGGIAPKILPLIQARFMTTFLDKAPMHGLLADVPVHVILNDQAGLVGAAVAALA
ncbi:MAG: glucokinase [Vicinamibacterales bacterium]